MKKIIISVFFVLVFSPSVWAAEQVWRYVDAKTGQVTYSNVQVKGQKGDRVEIMAYPVSPKIVSNRSALAAPIPAEVLRQLQGAQKPGVLPAGLPPLPALPGARLPSGVPLPISKAEAPPEESAGPEPKWAKEAPVANGPSPIWARDPFAAQK